MTSTGGVAGAGAPAGARAASFSELFGREPDLAAEAPGRANVIGEHTDYNAGFVLPVAIPQRVRVELAARDDARVRVTSADVAPSALEEYALGGEAPGRGWVDYVQGATRALARAGHVLRGFEALVVSRVPPGAGLSSSAALNVALLRALRAAFDLRLGEIELALLAQEAENDFVGARVGIMDPLASSLAGEREALFLDTRDLTFERVPLPDSTELVVLHSGVSHAHSDGAYNVRRAECERACALLGVRQLRDLDLADLSRAALLPEPLGRRVRHVVTENERVLAAVAAMRSGDAGRLGTLLDESHASLRDDYEVSVPEIDALVELARAELHVHGARLTGGGFGGSIVALAEAGAGRAAGVRIARRYAERTGLRLALLVPPPEDR